MKKIIDVDEDCNIVFEDGTVTTCKHRPPYTFQDCKVGYGPHCDCPKWYFGHVDIKSEDGYDL